MSGFKIIGLRILEGCDRSFLKNLKEGVVYQFYQNYSFLDENDKRISVDNNNLTKPIINISLLKDTVDIYSHNNLNIHISAIVGKNGSGKSTLLELLFLANYIIATKTGVLEPNPSTIEGELKTVEDLLDANEETKDEFVKKTFERLKNQKEIFEKLYSNFKSEVFYQIGKNIFCVKIDNDSIEQKLINGDDPTKRNYKIKNLLEDATFDYKEFFYSIAINYSLYGLNSNLMGDWIKALFHKNDAYQTPIVINPYRENGNINVNKELYLSKQRLISNLLKPVQSKTNNQRVITEKKQVEFVLYSLNTGKINSAYTKWMNGEEVEYSFEDISFGFHYDAYNKSWTTESKDNFIAKVLKAFLGDNYILQKGKLIKHYVEVEKYIIKKLIQIARTYSKYHKFFSDNNKIFDLPSPGDTKSDKVEFPPHSFYQIEAYLDLLVEDNSHITFKLRQAINYLKVDPFKSYELEKIKLPEKTIHAYRIPIDQLSKVIMPIAISQQNVIRFIPPSLFDIELELKASDEEKSISYYSMLSSGEQQLIQSVQSILYHINNLESVHSDKSNTDGEKKEYEIVNIVLDEIELYFHPEFQRKFINHLTKSLSHLGTDIIKNFNILFSTHSPFILSDIPASNVLRLKGGYPIPESEQTFGANIHQLLHNDFYLENGFIGEFAKSKIEEVVDYLRNKKWEIEEKRIKERINSETSEDVKSDLNIQLDIIKLQKKRVKRLNKTLTPEKCQEIIDLVGEPVLKDSLDQLFKEVENLESDML